MRPSWHRDLAALILLLAVCRSPAFAERVRPKPVQKPATVVKTFEESAYGGDKEMARSHSRAWTLVFGLQSGQGAAGVPESRVGRGRLA